MRIMRITRKSFLVSLLGILTAEVGFSDDRQNGFNDDCYNVTGGEICYSVASYGEPKWNTARDKCTNKNLSLPIIRNIEEQAALETYLRKLNSKYQNITDVWTSGKRKTYNNWTWTNGQILLSTAITIYHDYSAEKTHMMIYWWNIETGNMLRPENPVYPVWYLCQYKGRQCSGRQQEVNATSGCLVPSEDGNVNWYEARNECLSKGGDLPILTDQDLQKLKNRRFPNYNYWIGLSRVHWVWMTTNISKATSSSEEEVKYTNWAKKEMSNDGGKLCISIATNDSQWRASRCKDTMLSVVCEKRGKPQPSTTLSSTIEKSTESTTTTQTTATPTRIDSTSGKSNTTTTARNSQNTTVTIAITISRHSNVSSTPAQTTADSTSRKSTTATATNNPNGDSSPTAYAAIGTGVVVIIILCIVVILVVIWRKSKSSNNKMEPEQTDSGNTKEKKDKKTKVNPATTTTTEERSIYADIPLAEKTANDAPEAGQKGTVYASLDFNQGVTYLEPSKLYAVTKNTQNVSGPIYAEPLNPTGNGDTSAGSSPAVKIGPMGDVYALPTTNVTPSSDKTTERPIYANT